MNTNQVVTAVANSSGQLELILWKVDSLGKITKQYGTTYTLTVTKVSIAQMALGAFANSWVSWPAGRWLLTLLFTTPPLSTAVEIWSSLVGPFLVTP